ncbi:Uncharacterised protein [Delftia tsuruhatensis]|uniref:hypothetical protein n=1 Tax=Delftia tsuruhatensis TaxID=180282 RepID=UPI001E6C6008|nr:hypothetical protein [Delftia tsuruhatensis]CAB5686034.1 Uncharacterised protein [Delftia tsuruhatensis]CAC9690317.1 Uncharacterised protein [Delftia tsuruhatensis]
MIAKRLKTRVLAAFLGMASTLDASGQVSLAQGAQSPILLHARTRHSAFPVAAYRGIQVEAFRKLVIGAFKNAGFSSATIVKTREETVHYRFSYPVLSDGETRSVDVELKVDENLDKNRKCADCFLRMTTLPDLARLQAAPWMLQYDASRQVFQAIDQAYASIREDGRASMDRNFGFDYKAQWRGEKNLHENSFTGIEPARLKATIVEAYRAAGFTFMEHATQDPVLSELTFSFPIDPGQAQGVVYKMALAIQSDAAGRCHPCEISEIYDPHQRLPAAGLSGMSSRLTLEPRFAAARTLAFEKLKNGTERHLRPGTTFTTPPKPAPLGSPRPQIPPPVVT